MPRRAITSRRGVATHDASRSCTEWHPIRPMALCNSSRSKARTVSTPRSPPRTQRVDVGPSDHHRRVHRAQAP